MSDRNINILPKVQQECRSIDERSPGYREGLCKAVSEILENENIHQKMRTKIQQLVGESCTAVAQLLCKESLESDETN